MKIAFRYEEKVAQIILTPTSPTDETQIQLCQTFGDKNCRVRLAPDKGFIVEFNSNGGLDKTDARTN